MEFVVDPTQFQSVHVPSFEDARADFAPYYRSRATVDQAIAQVATELSKLGAYMVGITEGRFREEEVSRVGYELRFSHAGMMGMLRVAGLPIAGGETPAKVMSVRVQALLNVRDWLKAAITAQVFSPGTNPLLAHLLLPDGKTTVAEYIAKQGTLPQLAPPEIEIEVE